MLGHGPVAAPRALGSIAAVPVPRLRGPMPHVGVSSSLAAADPALRLLRGLDAGHAAGRRRGRPRRRRLPRAHPRRRRPAEQRHRRPSPAREPHTAQTYAVGSLPTQLRPTRRTTTAGWRRTPTAPAPTSSSTSPGPTRAWRCAPSSAGRGSAPTQAAWDAGARWYRCDVIGGGDQSTQLRRPPDRRPRDLLLGRPEGRVDGLRPGRDRGRVGEGAVQREARLAGRDHDRARATPPTPTPVTAAVQSRTKDFCSKSVGAWLDYPVDYDFGYSWFQRARVGRRQPPLRVLGQDRLVRACWRLRWPPPSLALTACSGSTARRPRPTPTPARSLVADLEPRPEAHRAPDPPPPAHACYRLGYADALAPTSTPEARAVRPAATPRSPSSSGASPRTSPSTAPGCTGSSRPACPRRFATFVGGTLEDRRLSLLRTVWFTPTLEQAALGARWFRASRSRSATTSTSPSSTARSPGALDTDDGRAHYGLCGTAEPGTSRLRAAHLLRPPRLAGAAHGRLPSPAPTPASTRSKSAGQQPCKDAGHAVASDPLNYRWSYQWPTLAQWRGGQTYGVCWAPS